VHSFEPDSVNAAILKHNVDLNDRRENCRIHALALSDTAETRNLYRGPASNTGLSTLTRDTRCNPSAFDVRCCTADELVFHHSVSAPTLLKIDVEGWEYRVLLGASRLFEERPPKALVFEAAPAETGCVADRRLLQALKCFGYVVTHIPRPAGAIEERENYLAVRTCTSHR
jgi:FkbM family methyltransferase